MLYSVLLPAHRLDGFLAESIDSIEVAMAGDDAELIIIANGPLRASISARYGTLSALPRRRVVETELPSLSHALNRGLEMSKGAYIARMDSDDLCLPSRFKTQAKRMGEGGVDFLFTRAHFIDADGGPVQVKNRKAS